MGSNGKRLCTYNAEQDKKAKQRLIRMNNRCGRLSCQDKTSEYYHKAKPGVGSVTEQHFVSIKGKTYYATSF